MKKKEVSEALTVTGVVATRAAATTSLAGVALLLTGLATMILVPTIYANAQGEPTTAETVTIQKTGVSDKDPLPGHEMHQLVMALPPRSDGKIWVGTVTWTASKPVETVVLQGYNSTVTADAAHGQPLTAPFNGGTIAISLIKMASGTPVASGSMDFAGNVLAFHTLNGDKFTVTYTVHATANQLTS
jgi:hypothetical protein